MARQPTGRPVGRPRSGVIPCVTCGAPSKSRGPASGERVCLPCYQQERKTLPPAPVSGDQLALLPAPRRSCSMCGRPAKQWVFDPYVGDPVRLKEGVLVDVRPFREHFSRDDFAAVCTRKECLEEFELDDQDFIAKHVAWLELLIHRVREGTLTARQLPEI